MKSLSVFINEAQLEYKTGATFKKEFGIKVPTGFKYKNGVGTFKCKKRAFEKWFMQDFLSKFKWDDTLERLGQLKDESSVYTNDGGETLRGSVKNFDDLLVTLDNGTKILFRIVYCEDDVYGSFLAPESNIKNEPMVIARDYIKTYKEQVKKLGHGSTSDATGEQILKEFFKSAGDNYICKLDTPLGKNKGIIELKSKSNDLYVISVNGEDGSSHRMSDVVRLYLSGFEFCKLVEEVITADYVKLISK